MKTLKYVFVFPILCMSTASIVSYDLPLIGLGSSSFLDGGPLRAKPGWYWQQYVPFYHSDRFNDAQGKPLAGIPSLHFNGLATATQAIYILKKPTILKAHPGFEATLPIALYSSIDKNKLGLRTHGGGLGDLFLGIFLQWNAIVKNKRPIFVHRLEFNTAFPTGKNKGVPNVIYPGNGIFFIDPYWSATLYFTPKWAASWRLSYLWAAKNQKTHKQAGQAIHANFSMEYFLLSRLWIGINGYFLQQITDSRLKGKKIPHSREQVVAIGPGALYILQENLNCVAFTNLYFELSARNRPQGLRFFFRFLKHF